MSKKVTSTTEGSLNQRSVLTEKRQIIRVEKSMTKKALRNEYRIKNVEKLSSFFLRSGTTQECPLSPLTVLREIHVVRAYKMQHVIAFAH